MAGDEREEQGWWRMVEKGGWCLWRRREGALFQRRTRGWGGVGGEDDFVRRGRVVLARKSPLSRSDFRVGIGVAGVHRRVCGNTQPRGGEAGGNDGGRRGVKRREEGRCLREKRERGGPHHSRLRLCLAAYKRRILAPRGAQRGRVGAGQNGSKEKDGKHSRSHRAAGFGRVRPINLFFY